MNKRKLVLRQKKAARRVMRECKKIHAYNLRYIIYACTDSSRLPYYCVHGSIIDKGTNCSFHIVSGTAFNKFGRKVEELKF